MYSAEKPSTQSLIAKAESLLQFPLICFIKSTNAGVLLVDEAGYLIYVNEEFWNAMNAGPEKKAILGQREEAVLSYLQHFINNGPKENEKLYHILIQKKVWLGEVVQLVDGRWIEINYIPLNDDGKYSGSIWQFVDITDKQVSNVSSNIQEDRYLKILNKLNVGYSEVDLDGKILRVSDSLCNISGYKRAELLGRNAAEFFVLQEEWEQAHYYRQQNLREGGKPVLYELSAIMKNDSRKWLLVSSANLYGKNGDAKGSSSLYMDITDQKILQQELERARKAAEGAQERQQRFLTNMSHEIRTPLNAIIGMSHLLETTSLNDVQKDYVKVLKNASGILLGLITDILDFSKIESGELQIHSREFNLEELIINLTNTFQHKLLHKPLKMRYELDSGIKNLLLGDDGLLNQVLLNLMGNAEKFTAVGEIIVKVKLEKQEGDQLWISFQVCDTGIGIPNDKIPQIFQDYKQADEKIRNRYGGTGLGLPICKKIIELQDGSIEVESEVGKGSCFKFVLPYKDTGKTTDVENSSSIDDGNIDFKGAQLLVVEDNFMNIKYLSSLLDKCHVHYDLSTDGNEAQYYLRDKYYQLVLLDMNIPGKAGMDVVINLRNEEGPNIATPIILITADALQDTDKEAKEAGANELLIKPYTPDQLFKLLKKYLQEEDDEENVRESEKDEHAFVFDSRLDVSYLEQLYDNDFAYASGLFGIFLESFEDEWAVLKQHLENKDWEKFKAALHKMKPNFAMVGLTWITQRVQKLYNELKQDVYDHAEEEIDAIEEDINNGYPIVVAEQERMLARLQTEHSE